jgi:hypothetical protein
MVVVGRLPQPMIPIADPRMSKISRFFMRKQQVMEREAAFVSEGRPHFRLVGHFRSDQ